MHVELHETDLASQELTPEARALLESFVAKAQSDGVPLAADFDAASYEGVAGWLMVLSQVEGGDFRYDVYGKDVERLMGFSAAGRFITDFRSDIGRYYHKLYSKVAANLTPVLVRTPSVYAFGVHMWQRLILPVRQSDGTIHLNVLCQPREMHSDLLNAILEKTRDGVMVMRFVREADGFVSDAKITMANPRSAEILGKGRIDLLDHGIRNVVPGLMSNGLWQRCLLVASTRHATTLETEFAENDVQGSFDISLVPFADGILMTFRDITTRARAEKAARATRLQLEQKNELLAKRVAELEARLGLTEKQSGAA
ncbi:MAG: PAS domain-containing protein [Bosea sp. (in: a-proteobacteria)]